MENLRFALVTSDNRNAVKITINGERYDCTGFMSWLSIWDGVHYSFDAIKEDFSTLFDYDCVMFSGSPAHLTEISRIATMLKGKVVTMFLPEGDVQFYDLQGINSFNRAIYDTWNSVDIVAIMEEDKIAYYENFTKALVRFIHVPIDERMYAGEFKVPLETKGDYIVIYGDNNPNCPVTVFGLAKRLQRPVITVCIPPEKAVELQSLFGIEIKSCMNKLGQYSYLRLLALSWLHIYPTRWIGSSREPIACAVAGTPCIGSDRSHTMKRLFPKLMCDIYDVKKMEELAQTLYSDNKDFYQEINSYAWSQIGFYSMENTKQRFMDAYNEIRRKM